MNYHSDEWINDRVKEHYNEALTLFPENNIVGIFYQGSGNYGLDYKGSDVDTKLIVTPKLDDIIFNHKPVSTTHVRANEEHIDLKDIRLYCQCFRKQNINFMEILFTPYKIVNPMYAAHWKNLEMHNELIARYNPNGAVATMKGIALEKYHAMEHPYPSKLEILARYGYDPKQLHHLLRVHEYLKRYITGESYAECLHSRNSSYLLDIKTNPMPLEKARTIANNTIAEVTEIADTFRASNPSSADPEVEKILDSVQYNIMRTSILKELSR